MYYDLVILIDCWSTDFFESEPHPELHSRDFYEIMLSKLRKLSFDDVAIATYPNEDHIHCDDCMSITDPYVLQNIKSRNNSTPACRLVHTLKDVYTTYPKLFERDHFQVLIGGLSWRSCVHWRPLGAIAWMLQTQKVHTHPDLVWNQGSNPHATSVSFNNDPFLEWVTVETDTGIMYCSRDVTKTLTREILNS